MGIVEGLAATGAIFVFGGIAFGMLSDIARTGDGEAALARAGISLFLTGLALGIAAVWTAVAA